MMARARLLFLLVYLTLDFASPWVPGAMNFAPDECVEAVRCHAVRAERPAGTALGDAADRPGTVASVRLSPVVAAAPVSRTPRVTSWLAPRRGVVTPQAESVPSSDDH